MTVIRVVWATAVALFVMTGLAAAQSASLAGRVIDPDRAVVAGAAVVLIQLPSGGPQTRLTQADGAFRFSGLAPGEYRLEITARGFSVHAQTITLTAGERTVTAALEIAPVREEITVEGVATVPTIGRIAVPLRDQPLTVNTLTSEFLQSRAINDVVTALNHVPNVVAYNQATRSPAPCRATAATSFQRSPATSGSTRRRTSASAPTRTSASAIRRCSVAATPSGTPSGTGISTMSTGWPSSWT